MHYHMMPCTVWETQVSEEIISPDVQHKSGADGAAKAGRGSSIIYIPTVKVGSQPARLPVRYAWRIYSLYLTRVGV